MTIFDRLGSLPRRVRWALHKWSPSADRDFHDALFKAQRFDPFTFAYPGYITIRRFAELTERHLKGVTRAYDLGCGPGEITCELARRNPEIAFVGVDHSSAAIDRANEHRAALKLTNVAFETADVSSFTPERAGIVLMYDSFHHLMDPATFVRRLSATVPKFLLIEPAGDWLGGWQKTLDLDWIPGAIEDVRARLAWQMSLRDEGRAGGPQSEERGEPVEHRYTLMDLQRFFEGYGLEVRGTIAGLGEYPPNPYAALPLRAEFGQIAADTLTAVEELLVRHDLDLHAKHWVLYAERGAGHRLRTPAPIKPREGYASRTRRPYDVEYGDYEGPDDLRIGEVVDVRVTLKNGGWRPWRSDEVPPVFLSYHWLDPSGAMLIEDGRRTPLPGPLLPGESVTLTARVEAPPKAGTYVLAFDLVEEGVTWFSQAGARTLRVRIGVRS